MAFLGLSSASSSHATSAADMSDGHFLDLHSLQNGHKDFNRLMDMASSNDNTDVFDQGSSQHNASLPLFTGTEGSLLANEQSPFPIVDEDIKQGEVEVIVRMKDKQGKVISEKPLNIEEPLEGSAIVKKDILKEVQASHDVEDFSVVDFLEDLANHMDEHTDLEKVAEFFDMIPVNEDVAEELYSPTTIQEYIESTQNTLIESGCEKLSSTTLQVLREEAGEDKELFMEFVQKEASRAILEKKVKAQASLPDEVYERLIEEPLLKHIGHENRRRLVSLKFKVCVPVVGPCVKFDLLKYIDDALEAIWGFVEDTIDAVLDVFLFVKRIVDACLSCSDRQEQSFVNVYDVFFSSFFLSYFFCFLCCIFCCSGQDKYGGFCLPIGMLCKSVRMLGAKTAALACYFCALPFMCQRCFHSFVCNKCCEATCCIVTFTCLFSAYCFNICSRENYYLESYEDKCGPFSFLCKCGINLVNKIVDVILCPCKALETTADSLSNVKNFTDKDWITKNKGKHYVTGCFCFLYCLAGGLIVLVLAGSAGSFRANTGGRLMYKAFEGIGKDVLVGGILGLGPESFGERKDGQVAKAENFDTENLPKEDGTTPPPKDEFLVDDGTEANLTRRLLDFEKTIPVALISYDDLFAIN
ncbi:MAG: hypothetical protein AAF335_02000 [Bacteroidota bacterium]